MRIAIVTVVYKETIRQVYSSDPSLQDKSYSVQKKTVDSQISTWTSGWENAFIKKGWEVFSIPINVIQMQRRWAEENNIDSSEIHNIAFKQIQNFKPDILWYDYFDQSLLKKIKSEVKSIKLFLGWTGSSIVDEQILSMADVVLSCAPEAVSFLKSKGMKAEHLNHAFNPLLIKDKSTAKDYHKFIFIGQIFRGSNFHNKREELLKKLVKKFDLEIFSPTYSYGMREIFLSFIKKTGAAILSPLDKAGLINNLKQSNKYLKEILTAKDKPFSPFNPELKKNMRAPVFGSKMMELIAGSQLVLNIHADSSPEFASNMRLFETTGAGTCLLTDWKKNLHILFEENKEVIAYHSDEECIEKAEWLIENPEYCKTIGKAGQQKTLSAHTFDNRIEELMEIINRYLK